MSVTLVIEGDGVAMTAHFW